ncbi:MAG: septum formation initiator family protein [Clostridia bacterium]|nr:septum formation initiator family protein [Clostridia bacterium]MBQ8398750.1 septum formation initiator family protein [Clostridia bacterium]
MKNDSHLLFRIAVALGIVLCIVTIIDLQLRLNRLSEQKEDLEQQIYEIEEEIAEMEYRISLPYDDDYAARVARMQLGYHYPDEYLFINDLYGE